MVVEVKRYKGFSIEVANDGLFSARDPVRDFETVASAETLGEVEKMLDKISKAKLNIPVIISPLVSGYTEGKYAGKQGTITSLREIYSYGSGTKTLFRVKIKDEKGWCEVSAGDLLEDTAENKAVLAEAFLLDEEQRRLGLPWPADGAFRR